MDYLIKLENLKKIIKNYEKAIVAFSGGVDSTFLLYVVNIVLDKSNFLAATCKSPIRKTSEIEKALLFAKKFNINIKELETNEMSDNNFIINPADRCYYCKKHIYSDLIALSNTLNIPNIFDGTNTDDLNEYRPGFKAIKELNIKTPLVEANISKKDVRELSKYLGLPTWNDISDTCLPTRMEVGTPITEVELKKIMLAETFLSNLGFKGFRVRNHINVARIEFLKDDIKVFFNKNYGEETNKYFREIGFKWVAVDVIGYRNSSELIVQSVEP